jgi:hypothetical protein
MKNNNGKIEARFNQLLRARDEGYETQTVCDLRISKINAATPSYEMFHASKGANKKITLAENEKRVFVRTPRPDIST